MASGRVFRTVQDTGTASYVDIFEPGDGVAAGHLVEHCYLRLPDVPDSRCQANTKLDRWWRSVVEEHTQSIKENVSDYGCN
jgi:hypothetical protein